MEVAKKMDFIHLNSGLMYRAVTFILIKNSLLNNITDSIQLIFKN